MKSASACLSSLCLTESWYNIGCRKGPLPAGKHLYSILEIPFCRRIGGRKDDFLNEVKTFHDFHGNKVRLVLSGTPFFDHLKHVWVICRFHKQWLLTRHLHRGLEFPGGKVEKDETADQAARREVNEETGAHIGRLVPIGQYQVEGRFESIIKAIYFAEIDRVDLKHDYLETDGPRFISRLPENIRGDKSYSFIMKDDVLVYALREIQFRLPVRQ
ncbi:nucleoside triphosphatase YtkD [Sporolactobacillus sp. THM7-7]|nr:nucleoside triphosphatase YtkD [Sporolactobacillus sp. THM7-7]